MIGAGSDELIGAWLVLGTRRIDLRADGTAEFFSPVYPIEVGDEGIVTDIIGVHERRFTLSVAECERCGRLWVQRTAGENSYLSFAPDEPGYGGVLRSQTL